MIDDDKKSEDIDNSISNDSPFMVAMLQNVGSLAKEIGKSAAKEVLLYSLKHAEAVENGESNVY